MGATGVGQICDLAMQIRGEAGERQIATAFAGAGAESGRVRARRLWSPFWGRYEVRGVVYTETVVHAAPEQFVADAPYQLAIVSLESGGRLTARIAGERVEIGDRSSSSKTATGFCVLPQSSENFPLLHRQGARYARQRHGGGVHQALHAFRQVRDAGDPSARFDPWAKHPSAAKILLDPAGKALDSQKLTALFRPAIWSLSSAGRTACRRSGSRAPICLLSLSPMTMPHELARVVLAEQIYRALTTLRGHPTRARLRTECLNTTHC